MINNRTTNNGKEKMNENSMYTCESGARCSYVIDGYRRIAGAEI